MLELLYDNTGNHMEEKSVMDFHYSYVKGHETENKFFKAIRDTRLAGFKDGMKSALQLFAEINGGEVGSDGER